jgi:hypothetical protein
MTSAKSFALVAVLVMGSVPIAAQTHQLTDEEWARVTVIKPGTEVTVTVSGAQLDRRYFVSADPSSLMVLDLHDVPDAAARVLRETAMKRPEYFSDSEKRDPLSSGDVRIAPDGVFLKDRKVADLAELLVTVSRTKVLGVQTGRLRGPHHLPTGAAVAIGAAIAIGGLLLVGALL